MSSSHVRKVKLDIVKLEKAKDKATRRRDSLNIEIFRYVKMIEGLKAATVIAAAPTVEAPVIPSTVEGQGV